MDLSNSISITVIGIQPGDRVVIFLPDVPELVIFILACFRVGAVVVPVVSHIGTLYELQLDLCMIVIV